MNIGFRALFLRASPPVLESTKVIRTESCIEFPLQFDLFVKRTVDSD